MPPIPTRAVTITGFAVAVAAMIVLEIVARRPGSRIPTVGQWLGYLMRPKIGRPPARPEAARAEPDPSVAPMRPRGGAPGGDLAGVLEGAGLDPADVTPELARAFGEIIRVVVSGVMDVLQSRRQIKDEFRMRMTQFRPAAQEFRPCGGHRIRGDGGDDAACIADEERGIADIGGDDGDAAGHRFA